MLKPGRTNFSIFRKKVTKMEELFLNTIDNYRQLIASLT